MNLDSVKAYVEGYQDHMFEHKCLTVYTGYWTGYYSNAKRPKPLEQVLKALSKAYDRAKRDSHSKQNVVSRPDVDVEQFMQRELRFKSKLGRK